MEGNGQFVVKPVNDKMPMRLQLDTMDGSAVAVVASLGDGTIQTLCVFREDVDTIDIQAILDAPFYVIVQNDGDLYWSNEHGWVYRNGATQYTEAERNSLNLPVGGHWLQASGSI